MPRQGRARQRMARAPRQAAARQGPRHGLLALRQRRGQADSLDRRAARGGQPQAGFRWRRDRAHRRRRYRPRLLHHGGDRRGGDAWTSRSTASASSPPTPRSRPRTMALIRRASPSWSATPRSMPPRISRPSSSQRRRAKTRGAPGRHRMRRGIPRRQRQTSEPAVRRCRGRRAGRRRRDHREGIVHLPAGHARRQAPGRRRRLDHGFQLRRPSGRGQRR